MRLERWAYWLKESDDLQPYILRTERDANVAAKNGGRKLRVYVTDADIEDRKKCGNCKFSDLGGRYCSRWDIEVIDRISCDEFEDKK